MSGGVYCNMRRFPTHLQSLVEDDLLSLESDVLGPLDESGQVLLGGDVASDTEGLGSLLEERVLGGLGGLLGSVWRMSDHRDEERQEKKTYKEPRRA